MSNSGRCLIDPIKIIVHSRDRIARLAAIRSMLLVTFPWLLTIFLALGLKELNGLSLDYLGYRLEDPVARWFQISLALLALAELAVAAALGWRSWSENKGVIGAAEEIDRRTTRRQEVVTLAGFYRSDLSGDVDPSPPLFPVLWVRVAATLETFDPATAFKLEARDPLIRSSILAFAALVFFGTTAFALMTRAGPTELLSHHLDEAANSLTATGSAPLNHQLVSAAHDVAKDLMDPKLPPREKIAELRSLEQELKRFETMNHGGNRTNENSYGGNNSGGGGTGSGNGTSSLGKSKARSPNTSASGQHRGGADQIAELGNDISKVRIALEQEAESTQKHRSPRDISSHPAGAGPQPGTNPQRPGNEDSTGQSSQIPRPQMLAGSGTAQGRNSSSPRKSQGSFGDTHLGEFPRPSNYERFYRAGEQGPPITIRNARYVTFQLPNATEAAGTGPLVSDESHPHATTPYTNAPLRQQRLTAAPDEEQLVPPRYRELIH